MLRIPPLLSTLVIAAGCGAHASVPDFAAMAPAQCRGQAAAVEWRLPEPLAERLELDRWCEGVGAPVLLNAGPTTAAVPASFRLPAGVLPTGPAVQQFDGVAGEDATEVAAAGGAVDSVVVVTWNVHVGGGDIRGLVADLRSGLVTGAPVAHFVLLLQEAHRTGGVPAAGEDMRLARGIRESAPDGSRTSIDAVARELGLSLAYVPSMRNGAGSDGDAEDRGNAILSTLPLRDVVALELPVVRQRRVAVAAVVDVPLSNGRVHALQLVSVHLENRPARGLTGVQERGEQMAWLLGALPHATSSVMGGDLNTWAQGIREPAYTLAAERYGDTGSMDDSPTHRIPLLPDVRLDYLLARLSDGGVSGHTRLDDLRGSDHHPVMAWIHLQ